MRLHALALTVIVSSSALAQTVMPPPLQTTWKGGELAKACSDAEQDADKELTELLATPAEGRTFEATFLRFDEIVTGYQERAWRLAFMKDIHPDAGVRDDAVKCDERANKYQVALTARRDLFGFLNDAHKAGVVGTKDPERARLADIWLLEFKKSGVALDDASLKRLVAIRSRLAEVQAKYQTSLNEDKTTFRTTKAELEGMTDAFIEAHADKKKKGVYVLTTKYPDYFPIMESAKSEKLRRTMELKFMQRGGPKNGPLLNEAVALRAEAAKLLGYETHADSVAVDRMAKDAATIAAFLTRVQGGLKPLFDREVQGLLALKQKDVPKAKEVNAWDWRYYQRLAREQEHKLDDAVVTKHFPTDVVLRGMYGVYEELFGITLAKVDGAAVWADGVELYEVKDAASGEAIARFYVDLYPRDGKYGHAAEFTLSSGQRLRDGRYRAPMCALVMNVTPSRPGAPSYLTFKEVETLFHEFGHVMHETLTTATYASLSGTRTALDFVEAPSQMLENWVYEPAVLARISKDPNDETKPMSPELAAKLKAARNAGAGVLMTRQIFLATFDQRIHTTAKVDSVAVGKKTWAEIMGFPDDKDARFAASFGHMMGGYDGGYYGYLWSEVFAADMFTRFEKSGAMNKDVGRAYRDAILARGKMQEPTELLKDFLGRAPNEAAFLGQLGIVPESL